MAMHRLRKTPWHQEAALADPAVPAAVRGRNRCLLGFCWLPPVWTVDRTTSTTEAVHPPGTARAGRLDPGTFRDGCPGKGPDAAQAARKRLPSHAALSQLAPADRRPFRGSGRVLLDRPFSSLEEGGSSKR